MHVGKRHLLIAIAILVSGWFSLIPYQAADAKEPECGLRAFGQNQCSGSDGKWHRNDGNDGTDSGDSSSGNTGHAGGSTGNSGGSSSGASKTDQIKKKNKEIDDHNQQAHDDYTHDLGVYEDCLGNQNSSLTANPCKHPSPPDYQERIPLPDDPDNPGGDEPTYTPPEAAWHVITAVLKIPDLGVGVGPSPDANRWHMAVVGYPYWLWADGSRTVAASADAGGLHVNLQAHVNKLYFDMGDGHKVQCQGSGTEYVAWQHNDDAKPAQSPNCGYIWQKVSGKGQDYTVSMTAIWAVDWEIGTATGTEYLATTATRQVHVGELQTVIER